MSRNTCTDHLRGICFKYLVKHSENFKDAGIDLDGSTKLSDKCEKKIREYYESLLSKIQDCEDMTSAMAGCSKDYKNIPQKDYFPFITKLVERYFESKTFRRS